MEKNCCEVPIKIIQVLNFFDTRKVTHPNSFIKCSYYMAYDSYVNTLSCNEKFDYLNL